MRDLPALLRAAERRVNAHVWPRDGADSHLASIPADRDTDTDLLLLEAANRIATLESALREGAEYLHAFTPSGTPAVDAFIAKWRDYGLETKVANDRR